MTPTVDLRRARLGVTLLFMTNGLVIANLAPRYPELRTSIGLSYGELGLAIMFAGAGALTFGLSAAALIRRFSSARVGAVSMIAMSIAAALATFSPNGFVFAAVLFIVGSFDSIVDVAQNSHGLRVQREYRRTIVNSFHAMWSVGAVLGGLMGGGAAGIGLPLQLHLSLVAGLVIVINLVGYRLLLPGPEPQPERTESPLHRLSFRRVAPAVWLTLGMLSLVSIAGAWVEDAGISWSASYLFDELNAGATVASLGLVSLMAMHFVGRLVGDRLIDRFGQRAVVRVGGLITAVGMGGALLFPTIPLTIVGFGLAGLGVATTIPAAMHAADELPGFRVGTGLTVVSWALRVGFMLSPVVVGVIADATSLRVGLSAVVVAGLLLMLLAQAMSTATATDTHTRSDPPA